ncbi:hypothetical protein Tsubulata_019609 [Turnera subulata]|uniref:Uncharacterized protein n=1 Tax=Turnera subulata TaxID=218843 RepID=A0A9Q0FAE9_9ROSI|nr:hypothetical protein Tsubulata_019609 [Turnera subulata]
MEANNYGDQNNKENIPPCSTNQTTPVLVKNPCFKKTFRRVRIRRPLAYITNQFKNPVQFSTSGEDGGSTSVLVVYVGGPNSRKRKTCEANEASTTSTTSKSLRIGFR